MLIKHALTTVVVKPVIKISNMSINMVSVYVHFFANLLLLNIYVSPSIMYVVCDPDTESMCVKLLVLKLSVISSDISLVSPIIIPQNRLLVSFGNNSFDF